MTNEKGPNFLHFSYLEGLWLFSHIIISLQDCVSTLVDLTLEDETGESVCLSSLKALTNLSLTSQHHGHYTRVVQRLYDLVDKGSANIKLQAAKVLVNLSCNPELVPHMLAAKVFSIYIYLYLFKIRFRK